MAIGEAGVYVWSGVGILHVFFFFLHLFPFTLTHPPPDTVLYSIPHPPTTHHPKPVGSVLWFHWVGWFKH